MNQIPNIEENKLAGKVVICDGLYTGKVGTILGIGSSQYSIKLLVDGLERYEPDYALLHVTEDNEQAIKLFLAHHQQLQKAREERENVFRELLLAKKILSLHNDIVVALKSIMTAEEYENVFTEDKQ